jgi:hypothetical protein
MPPAVEKGVAGRRGRRDETPLDKVDTPSQPVSPVVTGEEESLPEEFAAALNEVVYSDNLQTAQKQVEQLLVANNILPLVIGDRTAGDTDRLRWGKMARVSNFTQLARRGRDRVQYVAYVNSEQMRRIAGGLKVIRDGQTVSQLAVPETAFGFVASPHPSSAPTTSPAQTRPGESPEPWVAIEEIGGRLQLRRGGRAPADSFAPIQSALALPAGVGDIELLLITLNHRVAEGTSAPTAPPRSERRRKPE